VTIEYSIENLFITNYTLYSTSETLIGGAFLNHSVKFSRLSF